MKKRSSKSKGLTPGQNGSSSSVEPAEMKTSRVSLHETFDGWLNSVAPRLMRAPARNNHETAWRWKRALGPTELTRLNRATIRESTAHRAWPPDVVNSFLAADVIKNKSATQKLYEDFSAKD